MAGSSIMAHRFRSGTILSWLWCIAICLSWFVPSPVYSQQMFQSQISTFPDGDIYKLYGEPVNITCTLNITNHSEHCTSKDLEFSIGKRILQSEIINETSVLLYIENPDKQNYMYNCINKCNIKQFHSNRVVVDTAPMNVTDFKCISQNFDNMTCYWSTTNIYANMKYYLTYSKQEASEVKAKEMPRRSQNEWYCNFSSKANLENSQLYYRQQEEYYIFKLTGSNVFGNLEQQIKLNHYAVVKPQKPINPKVLSKGPHHVVLQWRISRNVAIFLDYNVVHRIEYQIAKVDDPMSFRSVSSVELTKFSNNETYMCRLDNLEYAHMKYEVRIYLRTNYSHEPTDPVIWSDFSYVLFETESKIPDYPPQTCAGAFQISNYEDRREIFIYWQQINEFDESGDNFTYVVNIFQNGKYLLTTKPDKNVSMSYIPLSNISKEALDVSIRSENSMGSSNNRSFIYIPAASQIMRGPPSFTNLAYENGTYELSWEPIDNIDNYTLFWCTHNTTKFCKGRMNFTTLERSKTNHTISLPSGTKYQFAIAVNNASSSSGMVWAECDISKNNEPMLDSPFVVTYEAPKKTYVVLSWNLKCKFRQGVITGYKISYCPVYNTSNICDYSSGNKSNVKITDSSIMSHNFTNLLPYTTYIFNLSLNTIYGMKEIIKEPTRVTTLEDAPAPPVNIKISSVTYNSALISWDPPKRKNSIIVKYVIHNCIEGCKMHSEVKIHLPANSDVRQRFNLTNLYGFTNYSWTVQACSNNLCSKVDPLSSVFMRTRIGPPSQLTNPSIKYYPERLLKWDEPKIPGGNVDLYQIMKTLDGRFEIIDIDPETSQRSLEVNCEGLKPASFNVRAVNYDYDFHHGVLGFENVEIPERMSSDNDSVFYGEWSVPVDTPCQDHAQLYTILLSIAFLTLAAGIAYGSLKYYKRYQKMGDIEPCMPEALRITEKDQLPPKNAFNWNPAGKDQKSASADEMLLLPNSKAAVPPMEIKLKDENCGASDQTDSTALSESSQEPIDQEASTSDEGSESSIHLDDANKNDLQDEEGSSCSESDSSNEGSPYFNDLKKNATSGYVQASPKSFMTSPTSPVKRPPQASLSQPTTSSYVMASPIITSGTNSPAVPNSRKAMPSGYVRQEAADPKSFMNFPTLGMSPTKPLGPESLPTMLLQPTKTGSGYMQFQPTKPDGGYMLQSLQPLEALQPQKPVIHSHELNKPTSSGYVSPGDALFQKHLNMQSGGHLVEERAICDPEMSPDAYCRFSWSKDPTNDNLHSLLAESSVIDSTNN